MAKFKSAHERILEAISSTEASTFSEFCSAYSDTPERGDKEGWRELFKELNKLEGMYMVTVVRDDNRIEFMQLTEGGVAYLKELQAKAF